MALTLPDPDADPTPPDVDNLVVALGALEARAPRLLHDIAGARHASALREAFGLKDKLLDLRAAIVDLQVDLATFEDTAARRNGR